MKTLRKETISFLNELLKFKINDSHISFYRKAFNKFSSSSFYKKVNSLEKNKVIKIVQRKNGLIIAKINPEHSSYNKRNTFYKPIVKLTPKQKKILHYLKLNKDNLDNFNPTIFCKKYNFSSKDIIQSLRSLEKNQAIKIQKISSGVYNIHLMDCKIIGQKDEKDYMQGYIYLIQNEKTKNLKIGFTEHDIKKRLKQLQTGNENKLKIIAFLKGNFQKERIIHEKFKALKLKGEWFMYHDQIVDFFNNGHEDQNGR